MVTIDESMIAAHGIVVTPQDMPEFLTALQDRVQEQVGYALIAKLNDEDAKELLNLSESASQEQIDAWLGEHLPDYNEIALQEVDAILSEIAAAQKEQQ